MAGAQPTTRAPSRRPRCSPRPATQARRRPASGVCTAPNADVPAGRVRVLTSLSGARRRPRPRSRLRHRRPPGPDGREPAARGSGSTSPPAPAPRWPSWPRWDEPSLRAHHRPRPTPGSPGPARPRPRRSPRRRPGLGEGLGRGEVGGSRRAAGHLQPSLPARSLPDPGHRRRAGAVDDQDEPPHVVSGRRRLDRRREAGRTRCPRRDLHGPRGVVAVEVLDPGHDEGAVGTDRGRGLAYLVGGGRSWPRPPAATDRSGRRRRGHQRRSGRRPAPPRGARRVLRLVAAIVRARVMAASPRTCWSRHDAATAQ